jgi:hypothetical protein
MIFNVSLTKLIKSKVYFWNAKNNMIKSVTAIVFSIIFTSLTVIPNIIAIVDDNYDISILIDSNEEEEKKGEEKVKDFEIELLVENAIEDSMYNTSLIKLLNTHLENYSSLFKELTSPPPEISI